MARAFPTGHMDAVHDVRYDYYGKRFATCSSDQSVKVWDLNEKGEWYVKEGGEWKTAHQGMIWKLAWAHPEFGSIIATCSSDRTVKIWEEQEGLPTEEEGGQSRWYPKAQLGDSRKQVRDVEFAPHHMGLKLAAAAAGGHVRIYEAIDVMNLSHWNREDCFQVDSRGATCLSWSKCRFDKPMLAVGTDSGRVQVWSYDEAARAWKFCVHLETHSRSVCDVDWAPNVGRSYHLIASTSKDGRLFVNKLRRRNGSVVVEDAPSTLSATVPATRVNFNSTGSVLATGGDENVVRLWKKNLRGQWVNAGEVCGPSNGS